MISQEHKDALARVIDPMSWDLSEDPRWDQEQEEVKIQLLAPSRRLAEKIADSGLMASGVWDRKEYTSARNRIFERTSRTGKCYSVEDGLDGYFMHDPKCSMWPEGAIGGSDCIK